MSERRFDCRVLDANERVVGFVGRFTTLERALKFAAKAPTVATLRHYEPPFRVQSRVVTIGDWKDET